MRKFLYLVIIAFCPLNSYSQTFSPDINSLRQYNCPEWFRDAKFGIWSCWNAYTVPGQGDWYARNMYIEGSKAYCYHCKTYGHPSEFGYKDVVDLWTADKFNPKEQVKLFEEIGAKYFVAMANHHDNFDLWDSKYQVWNSVNYGPKRNIIKEWYDAVNETSLHWGITSHLERTWSWFQVNKLSDKKGKYKGIPYDGNKKEYEFIYLPPEPTGDISGSQPKNATKWWRDNWYKRCVDLIDKYQPELFYVDGGVPFPGEDRGKTGLKMIAHLYNSSSLLNGGKNESVMCLKNWYHIAPKGEWGYYWDGIGTLDYERGRSSEILDEPWQTDTYLGAWTWMPDIKYRDAKDILCELVDVVSKNGNLLLNVTPKPDGTLDIDAVKVLKDIGRWMKVNSESIYETRPWLIYGDGDLRIVRKKNRDDLLYVSSMKKPSSKSFLIPFLGLPQKAVINKIELIGYNKSLLFNMTSEGLLIEIPEDFPGEYIWCFKIEGENLNSFDVSKYIMDKCDKDAANQISIWIDMSIKDKTSGDEYIMVGFDELSNKWVIDKNYNLIRLEDGKPIRIDCKAKDFDFSTTGYAAFIDLHGNIYFRSSHSWKFRSFVKGAEHISVSDDGTVWISDKEMNLWKMELNLNPVKIKTFKVKELACGNIGELAIVDDIGRIRFLKNGLDTGVATGVNISDLDYSPKTNHLVAIYDGELAVFNNNEWFFTGIAAKKVSCGKSNDDEIIGWINNWNFTNEKLQ